MNGRETGMIRAPWQATDRQLRVFAGVLALLCIGIGLRALLAEEMTVRTAVWGLGALLGVAGLVRPGAIRWLYLLWLVAVLPVGWLVSHFLLAAFFFGLLTPLGWTMRLLGRDPLLLRPGSHTSWLRRERGTRDDRERTAEDYLRQA